MLIPESFLLNNYKFIVYFCSSTCAETKSATPKNPEYVSLDLGRSYSIGTVKIIADETETYPTKISSNSKFFTKMYH